MENHPENIQPNQNIQPNLPPPEEDVVEQNQPEVEPEYMFNNSDEDSQDTMDILNQALDFDDEPFNQQPENQMVPNQPLQPFNQQPENQMVPNQPLQPFNQQNQPGVEPEYIFNDSTEIFQYNQQQENLDELFFNQPPPQPENQNQIVANQLPPQPFNQQPENENENQIVTNQAPPQPPFNQNQQRQQAMPLIDLIDNNPPPIFLDADSFLFDLNNDPNPFQDFLNPPNPVVHKHKEVYQHEDGKWYAFARLGPFRHVNEAKFARLHLPPDNLRGFAVAGLLYEKTLAQNDFTRASLPVTDHPNTTLPMLPLGHVHRVWDPYQRQWWDFTTASLGSLRVLTGWVAYRRAHSKLYPGDKIQFRSATNNLTGQVFYVLVHVKASPGSTNYELPYENIS